MILPILFAWLGLAAPTSDTEAMDPWLTVSWLPLEITQGVVAVQGEVSLPGWLGLSASVGTDGRPFAKGSPLEAAVQLRYYFLRPFSGFDVGVFGGAGRSKGSEAIYQAAPIAGYKWIASNGFSVDGLGGWSWVWGDRQQAGHFLASAGLGYTW